MHHFYKAGARIARTGGTHSEQVMLTWCVENQLSGTARQAVFEGYHDELNNSGRNRRLGG